MAAPVVALHLWGTRHPARAVTTLAQTRPRIRRLPGCTFTKLLGTGHGTTFSVRDADLHHWAAVTCWSTPDALASFASSAPYAAWSDIAYETATLVLRPLRSRGSWSGRDPFTPTDPEPTVDCPLAVLTRARIRPTQWRRFWSAVPPVAADLRASDALLAFGFGEVPVGFQGTFSVWPDQESLRDFAYGTPAHRDAIRRTDQTGWYAEQLFARFAVDSATGHYRGETLVDLLHR